MEEHGQGLWKRDKPSRIILIFHLQLEVEVGRVVGWSLRQMGWVEERHEEDLWNLRHLIHLTLYSCMKDTSYSILEHYQHAIPIISPQQMNSWKCIMVAVRKIWILYVSFISTTLSYISIQNGIKFTLEEIYK